MSRKARWFIAIGIFLIVFVAVGVAVVITATAGPRIRSNSVLFLDIMGEILEEGSDNPFEKLFEGEQNTFKDHLDCIEKAAGDERIRGIYMRVGGSDISWAKIQELRDALASFKKSEKPLVAFMEVGGMSDYYLATGSDRIYMMPAGFLDLTGLLTETSFLKGTLAKLGIKAEFEHVAEYKTASDLLTRDSMSDAHREMMNSLMDSLFNRFIKDVSSARKISEGEIKKIIDRGLLTPQEALNAKLVDELKYHDEIKDMLKEQFGAEYHKVIVDTYKKSDAFGKIRGKKKIAILYATGSIVSGESSSSPYWGKMMGSDTIAGAFEKIRKDGSIKAVVMRVDSPGGSGIASDVIWRETQITRKQIPLVVSMSGVAGSGGYYISMGADTIVVEPGTLTGSIGVIAGKFNMRGFYDWIGWNKELIKRGENADIFSSYVGFSEEQRKLLMDQIYAFYRQFIHKAAEGRGKSDEDIDRIGKGRVWTGEQALELGLVDEIGGLNRAIEIAKEKAGIAPEEEVGIVIFPKKKGLWQMLIGGKKEDTLGYLMKTIFRIPDGTLKEIVLLNQYMEAAKDGIVLMM
ncbi:MAG: signal peptide peptidase SppA [Acidobacteriota bacterium]